MTIDRPVEGIEGLTKRTWLRRGIVLALVGALCAGVLLSRDRDTATVEDPIGVEIQNELLVSGLDLPIAMEWLPDGRILIAEQPGRLKMVDPTGTSEPEVVLDITEQVNFWVARGLIGMALHPDFPSNPTVYLSYTYDPPEAQWETYADDWDGVESETRKPEFGRADARGQRVSRVTRWDLDPATNFTSAVPDSEVVLVGTASEWDNIGDPYAFIEHSEAPPSCVVLDQPGDPVSSGVAIQDCISGDSGPHNMGALEFDLDGMLYVGLAEPGSPEIVDPRSALVQDLDILAGKILRIDPATGLAPTDNPFFDGDAASNRSRVYQYGLRNPFRFIVDPDTGNPLIGDVGWNLFEEINTGPAGANFGWPCFEGGLAFETMSSGVFAGPGESLPSPGYSELAECAAPIAADEAIGPIWNWCHDGAHVDCVQDERDGFRSAFVGTIYNGDAYPEEYRGMWFGDLYGETQIMDLESGTVIEAPIDLVIPLDISVGPDDLIYYVDAFGSLNRLTFGIEIEQRTCNGVVPTVDLAKGGQPTELDDVILGTDAADVIDGLGGDDIICGGQGDDLLTGGEGQDAIYGEGGSDVLQGGPAEDQLFGGNGADVAFGGEGDDVLAGGFGDDELHGEDGDDSLDGDAGDDYLVGGPGINTYSGGDGDDYLDGGEGSEVMNGGPGNDELHGLGGDDNLSGDAGDDFLVGGPGINTYSGGDGDDYLDGGEGSEVMNGGPGNDQLHGNGGDDNLSGDSGSDFCAGGPGSNTIDPTCESSDA